MVKNSLIPGWFILDVACAHKTRDLLVHLRGNPPHHDEKNVTGKILIWQDAIQMKLPAQQDTSTVYSLLPFSVPSPGLSKSCEAAASSEYSKNSISVSTNYFS